MPGASVKVGPVRVGSGCCVALVIPALAILLALFVALGGIAFAKQYVLKHPKHEHCKSGYIKKVVKKYKRRAIVRETICVLAPTKPDSVSTIKASSVSTTVTAPAVTSTTTSTSFSTTSTLITSTTSSESSKTTKDHQPIETVTTLNADDQECGEEIKKNLIPYAKIKWCKYNLNAIATSKEDAPTPRDDAIWLIIPPEEEGFQNNEFEAQMGRSYETTVEIEEELGIRGEVTHEGCAIEISENLYFIKNAQICKPMTITALYEGDEVNEEGTLIKWQPSQSKPVYLEV